MQNAMGACHKKNFIILVNLSKDGNMENAMGACCKKNFMILVNLSKAKGVKIRFNS